MLNFDLQPEWSIVEASFCLGEDIDILSNRWIKNRRQQCPFIKTVRTNR